MSESNWHRLTALMLLGLFGTSSQGYAASTSTVSVTVTGSGSVESSPAGINCPGVCDADFAKSGSLMLTATPEADQTFLGWLGDCAGTDPVCVVKTNKSRNATANFSSS